MEKSKMEKLIFIFSILICLFLLIANMFSWTPLWAFMEIFTSHSIINIYMVFSLIIITSLIYFLKGIKLKKLKLCTPFFINLITLLLLIFIPFNDIILNYDIQYNFDIRNEIIKKIKNQELVPDNKGILVLPFWYKYLSKGGEVFIESDQENLNVLFFTFRGVLDNFSGIIYIENAKKFEHNMFEADMKQIRKINENWYWIASW